MTTVLSERAATSRLWLGARIRVPRLPVAFTKELWYAVRMAFSYARHKTVPMLQTLYADKLASVEHVLTTLKISKAAVYRCVDMEDREE